MLPTFSSDVIYVAFFRHDDGAMRPCEAETDKDSAYDAAVEALKHGWAVRVFSFDTTPQGFLCAPIDVTSDFYEARGIGEDDDCPDCGRAVCVCDEAYDILAAE